MFMLNIKLIMLLLIVDVCWGDRSGGVEGDRRRILGVVGWWVLQSAGCEFIDYLWMWSDLPRWCRWPLVGLSCVSVVRCSHAGVFKCSQTVKTFFYLPLKEH